MNTQDQHRDDRDNVFHERAAILREKGYGGFKISKVRQKWESVAVTVKNDAGRTLTASGETELEAYTKLIDEIDRLQDEPG